MVGKPQACRIENARFVVLVAIFSDSKRIETSFSPISTDSLCLQHARMPLGATLGNNLLWARKMSRTRKMHFGLSLAKVHGSSPGGCPDKFYCCLSSDSHMPTHDNQLVGGAWMWLKLINCASNTYTVWMFCVLMSFTKSTSTQIMHVHTL